MTHQPAINFSISFLTPFNRAGGRTFDVRQNNDHMGREYKILCKPTEGVALHQLLLNLPPPFHRPQMQELYNYRVDEDGYYLVDHLVDRSVAATALQVFLDAALSSAESVTIIEP